MKALPVSGCAGLFLIWRYEVAVALNYLSAWLCFSVMSEFRTPSSLKWLISKRARLAGLLVIKDMATTAVGIAMVSWLAVIITEAGELWRAFAGA